MMDYIQLERAVAFVRSRWPQGKPELGLLLGSGWGEVVEAFDIADTLPYEEIPGLGKTAVSGHPGRLCLASLAGVETLIFQGRRHWYEGEGWTPIALPVFLLKALGARGIMITNAAGGIRADLRPGSLMMIDDHINFLGANPLAGPHNACWGPRFPDQSEVYSLRLRERLAWAARSAGEELAHGIYLANAGPVYETPAEIRAFRTLGADAVGMSTVGEAMLAHAAGLHVVGLSCISNLAAGLCPQPLTHEEVTETTRQTMRRMKSVVSNFWKEIAREGI